MSLALISEWHPIETAPKSYRPPLSIYNHHAPNILGLWGHAFYCICHWGGDHNPYWLDNNDKHVPFQPIWWMPLPPLHDQCPHGMSNRLKVCAAELAAITKSSPREIDAIELSVMAARLIALAWHIEHGEEGSSLQRPADER